MVSSRPDRPCFKADVFSSVYVREKSVGEGGIGIYTHADGGQKVALDLLELELQTPVLW